MSKGGGYQFPPFFYVSTEKIYQVPSRSSNENRGFKSRTKPDKKNLSETERGCELAQKSK